MKQESGLEYLARLATQFEMANRVLPTLAEDEFAKIRKESLRKEIGVESFLMDFAIEAETKRRNIERWSSSRSTIPASTEHDSAIISVLPAYTTASPEALAAMRVESAKKFRLDVVVEDILVEIAQRLPRTVDAYRFHQNYAQDTLDIPGIGDIEVKMHETGNGIFRTIGTVEADGFRIWNCRQSGVTYLDRYNDISKPSEVTIKNDTKIKLYEDNSGTFVEKDGRRYTNGYAGGDNLHRTYDGPNPDAPAYKEANNGWREDTTVLSLKQIEDHMIIWLAENVLNPLRATPKPENQITELPEEEPYPEGKVGPLYTFAADDVLRKIALVKDHPERAFLDERKAISPGRRLLSLGMPRGDAPENVYDGFIYCEIGTPDEEDKKGLAIIKPKTATDVFVIDRQPWEDFREKTFTSTHDRLTNAEYNEMHQVVARTIIPITEYKGDYKKPEVIVSRDLELDEIEAVYLK